MDGVDIDGGKLGQEFPHIGVQDLGSYCCHILIGTSPRPDLMMAHICSSEGEEHHMSLSRQVIGIYVKEQELFQFHVPGASSIMARRMTFRSIFSHRGRRESSNIHMYNSRSRFVPHVQ
jgi:hypothetical protein